jgi:hypothetical protein
MGVDSKDIERVAEIRRVAEDLLEWLWKSRVPPRPGGRAAERLTAETPGVHLAVLHPT